MSNAAIEHFTGIIDLGSPEGERLEGLFLQAAKIIGGEARGESGLFTFVGSSRVRSDHQVTVLEASGRYARDKTTIHVYFDKPASRYEEIDVAED